MGYQTKYREATQKLIINTVSILLSGHAVTHILNFYGSLKFEWPKFRTKQYKSVTIFLFFRKPSKQSPVRNDIKEE